MKKARSFYFSGFPFRSLLILLVFFLIASNVMEISHYSLLGNNDAYGHLTETPGAQSKVMLKSIGSYDVLFQRVPPSLQAGENSTLLRFSIMQNNQDTYGIFASLTIKEKSSGNISTVFPYKFYEFGDIDFRHTFQNAVEHEVMLQARISGDSYYQNNPLVASFDVPVITEGGGGGALDSSAQIIVISVFIALLVGIIILILDFNKRTKRESSSSTSK
jgi:hypothetical protein